MIFIWNKVQLWENEKFTDKWQKKRMTTFIKAKLTKSDDQINIDKYRVAANIYQVQN